MVAAPWLWKVMFQIYWLAGNIHSLPKRRNPANVSRQTLTILILWSLIPVYCLGIVRGREEPQTMHFPKSFTHCETHSSKRQIGALLSESKGVLADIKVFLLEQLLLDLFITQDHLCPRQCAALSATVWW